MVIEDYYQVLALPTSASQLEVKQAFFKKIRLVHPDVNPSPTAQEECKKVFEAFRVLSNPEERKKYDAEKKRPTSALVHYRPPTQQTHSTKKLTQQKEPEFDLSDLIDFELPDLPFFDDFGSAVTDEAKAMGDTAAKQLFSDLV